MNIKESLFVKKNLKMHKQDRIRKAYMHYRLILLVTFASEAISYYIYVFFRRCLCATGYIVSDVSIYPTVQFMKKTTKMPFSNSILKVKCRTHIHIQPCKNRIYKILTQHLKSLHFNQNGKWMWKRRGVKYMGHQIGKVRNFYASCNICHMNYTITQHETKTYQSFALDQGSVKITLILFWNGISKWPISISSYFRAFFATILICYCAIALFCQCSQSQKSGM